MKKSQLYQVFIGNGITLGKGEVACSNHAGSTITTLLRRCKRTALPVLFLLMLVCIYAKVDVLLP